MHCIATLIVPNRYRSICGSRNYRAQCIGTGHCNAGIVGSYSSGNFGTQTKFFGTRIGIHVVKRATHFDSYQRTRIAGTELT